MTIEQCIVVLALIIVSHGFGYVIGWHRCAEYIMSRIAEGGNHETDRGSDEHV